MDATSWSLRLPRGLRHREQHGAVAFVSGDWRQNVGLWVPILSPYSADVEARAMADERALSPFSSAIVSSLSLSPGLEVCSVWNKSD